MAEKAPKDVRDQLRNLAREVGENHEWLDADELEDDEAFARLVELLVRHRARPRRSLRDGGTRRLEVSARRNARGHCGRKSRTTRLDRAREEAVPAGRVRRTAAPPRRTRPLGRQRCVAAVLAAADEDWSGSPLAKAIAGFLDARVARGERLSAGDFARLSPGLQPLVSEILETAGDETKAALGPAVEQWQRESIDVDFFKSLGRVVDPARHPNSDNGRLARRRRRRDRRSLGRTSPAVALTRG